MYKFVDINEQTELNQFLSDNLNINGKPLQTLVEGYQQIGVSGRGLMSYRVNVTDVPLRDGAFFNYRSLEPRILEVQYVISAKNANEWRERFVQLNKALSSENMEITFDDEPNWYYYGFLSDVTAPAENLLNSVGSFQLLCVDPYSYGETQQSNGLITLEYADEVLPDKIEITTSATERIEISNGRDKLIFSGAYSSGDDFEIFYYQDHVSILKNGGNVASDLEWQHYPETFFLRDQDKITVSGGTLISIEWRDKRL